MKMMNKMIANGKKRKRTTVAVAVAVVVAVLCVLGTAGDIASEPFQIVEPDEAHQRLVIPPGALERLRAIDAAELPVLGIVGSFHTGKSFLLNQLVGAAPGGARGFEVGPAVHPQTHGIWAWVTRTPTDGRPLLVLDTEGFFAAEANDLYDSKIFAVATLMSSTLMYNTMKIIDQSQIDYLELLAHKAELFSMKHQLQERADSAAAAAAKEEGSSVTATEDEYDEELPGLVTFPPLFWVVRDFSQHLETTPTEWLHGLLAARQVNESGAAQNVTHETLLSVFPETACYTLFVPSADAASLQDLGAAAGTDARAAVLTPQWRADVARLRAALERRLEPKRVRARGSGLNTGAGAPQVALGGAGLATMLEALVGAANRDALFPVVPSAWQAFVNSTGREAVDAAAAQLDAAVRRRLAAGALPLDAFNAELRAADAGARALMQQMLFGIETLYAPFGAALDAALSGATARLAHDNSVAVQQLAESASTAAEALLERTLAEHAQPLARSAFEAAARAAVDGSARAFEAQMGAYRTVPGYDHAARAAALRKHLQGAVAVQREHNAAAIAQTAASARERALDAFAPLGAFAVLRSSAELARAEAAHRSEAQGVFNAATARLAVEPEVRDEAASLRARLDALARQYAAQNAESVREHGSAVVTAALRLHRAAVGALALPVDEDALARACRAGETAALRHYDANMTRFADTAAYRALRAELVAEARKLDDLTRQHNKEMLKLALREPRDAAARQLRQDVKRYWLLASFRRHARAVFDRAIGDAIRSDALKRSVVDDFVDEAVAEYGAPLKAVETTILVVAGALIAFAVSFPVLSRLHSSRSK